VRQYAALLERFSSIVYVREREPWIWTRTLTQTWTYTWARIWIWKPGVNMYVHVHVRTVCAQRAAIFSYYDALENNFSGFFSQVMKDT
jgi:hypothetical protein